VAGRLVGLYRCTVSNNKPSEASAEFLVQAAGTPSGISITRSGLHSIQVSWNPSLRATGYIIIYQQDGQQFIILTNTTSAHVTELTPLGATYNFTIVAISSDTLPSESDPVIYVLDFPAPVIYFETSGPQLNGQTFNLSCFVEVIHSDVNPQIELLIEGPNGTVIAFQTNTPAVTYTFNPLQISDSGLYNCTATVNILEAGVLDVQVSTVETVSVAVAFPVETLNGEAENNVIHLTWEPPSFDADLTTGYVVSCTTLMEGIPQPKVQNIPPNETSTFVSGYNGVSYTCEIFTETVQGNSLGSRVNVTIPETVPSGSPENLSAEAAERDVTFSWSPPDVTLRNGNITEYSLSCSPSPSSLPQSFPEPGTYRVAYYSSSTTHVCSILASRFSPATSYNCSVVAINSKGAGPPAFVSFTTAYDYKLFQLRLINIGNCPLWVEADKVKKISNITSAVVRALKEMSVCDIQSKVVDKPAFKCYPDSPSYVTLRGQLNGTATEDSTSLISSVKEWVSTSPEIHVNSVLLGIDSTCSVAISSLTELECLEEIDSTSNTTSSHDAAPLAYGVTVAGILSVIVFLAVLVFCVMIMCRKRCNKYRLRKTWDEVQDKDMTIFHNESYHRHSTLAIMEEDKDYSFVDSWIGAQEPHTDDKDYSFVDSWIGAQEPHTYDYPRFSPQSESSEPLRAILYPASGNDSANFQERYADCTPPTVHVSQRAFDGNKAQQKDDRPRGLSDSYVPCTPPLSHTPNVRASLSVPDGNKTQQEDGRPRGLSDSYVACTPPLSHTGNHCLPQQPPSVAERAETEKKAEKSMLRSALDDDLCS
jgi:hypothetical protein